MGKGRGLPRKIARRNEQAAKRASQEFFGSGSPSNAASAESLSHGAPDAGAGPRDAPAKRAGKAPLARADSAPDTADVLTAIEAIVSAAGPPSVLSQSVPAPSGRARTRTSSALHCSVDHLARSPVRDVPGAWVRSSEALDAADGDVTVTGMVVGDTGEQDAPSPAADHAGAEVASVSPPSPGDSFTACSSTSSDPVFVSASVIASATAPRATGEHEAECGAEYECGTECGTEHKCATECRTEHKCGTECGTENECGTEHERETECETECKAECGTEYEDLVLVNDHFGESAEPVPALSPAAPSRPAVPEAYVADPTPEDEAAPAAPRRRTQPQADPAAALIVHPSASTAAAHRGKGAATLLGLSGAMARSTLHLPVRIRAHPALAGRGGHGARLGL